MLSIFHIHVPKTAGSSLNALFAKVYGSDFDNHGKDPSSERPRARAAHLGYAHARRNYPGALLCTVLRDPVARLQSHMAHVFARRESDRYAKKGTLVARLVESEYAPSCAVLEEEVFCREFDNKMVRFLVSKRVTGRVTEGSLRDAIESTRAIDFVCTTQTLATDVQRLFERLGKQPPPLPHNNRSALPTPLFTELPPALEPLVRYDRELYRAVLAAAAPDGVMRARGDD
jgi:hypothetical protein